MALGGKKHKAAWNPVGLLPQIRRIIVITFPNISPTVNNNKKGDPGGFTTITIRDEYRMQISKAPQF